MGYHRAGFEVVGVDIERQPRYPFEFHQADAILYSLDGFDVIHASPPCQDYSSLKGLQAHRRPRLVPAIRARLRRTATSYVIENVIGSDLEYCFALCGSSFGLGVRRHRLFEMSEPPAFWPQCEHDLQPEPIDVTGTGGPFNGTRKATGGGVSRKPRNIAHAREAMGINWMTRRELSEAIPPAYTEWIGRYLMALLPIARRAGTQ